jgi:hypothetical protein
MTWNMSNSENREPALAQGDLLPILKTDVYTIKNALKAIIDVNILLVDKDDSKLPQFLIPDISKVFPFDFSQDEISVGELKVLCQKLNEKALGRGQIMKPNSSIHLSHAQSSFLDEASYHINKVLQLLRGLLEVLLVHFKRLPNIGQSFVLAIKWMNLSIDDRLEDWYKFQSCYLFSLVTKQDKIIGEMPKAPTWLEDKPGYILGGWFYRYCRTCITNELTPEVMGQFCALMYVKRAGAAISDRKQTESLIKHVKNMLGMEYTPKPVEIERLDPEDHTKILKSYYRSEDVLDLVKTRLEDLLDHGFKGKKCDFKWRSPSVNSCYESTAMHGGPHSVYRKSAIAYCNTFIGFAHYKTKVLAIYVPFHPDDLYGDAIYMFDRKDRYIVPIASVHKVLEPFKCRVITAGPGNVYQLGRIIQHPLHNIMRHHLDYTFALIGRPVDAEFLRKVYGDTVVLETDPEGYGMLPDGRGGYERIDFRDTDKCRWKSFFAAVDYSTSTDGIHPMISESFVKRLALLIDMSESLIDAALKTVEGHILEYTFDRMKDYFDVESSFFYENVSPYLLTDDEVRAYGYEPRPFHYYIKQSFGQLMGSPLSFLILTYLNAAINWVAADLYERKQLTIEEWQDSYRPIFNGDDGSFLSNPVHYKIWLATASCAGLNSSLGKTYCTRDFVMINSEIYSTNMSGCLTGTIEDIFVLNPGLVKGQAKVMGDTRSTKQCLNGEIGSKDVFQVSDHKMVLDKHWSKDKPDIYGELLPLVDQLNVCLRKCEPDRASIVKDIFYDHVVPKLKETIRPWSLPRPLGGLGLDIGHINYSQSLLALRCFEDPSIVCTSYKKEVPMFTLAANAVAQDIEKALGVEYSQRKFGPPEKVESKIYTTIHGLFNQETDKFLLDMEALQMVEDAEWEAQQLLDPQDLTLDKYFLGADREEHGEDIYSRLLKQAQKNAWGHIMSEDTVAKYRGYEYTAERLVSPILMC